MNQVTKNSLKKLPQNIYQYDYTHSAMLKMNLKQIHANHDPGKSENMRQSTSNSSLSSDLSRAMGY